MTVRGAFVYAMYIKNPTQEAEHVGGSDKCSAFKKVISKKT